MVGWTERRVSGCGSRRDGGMCSGSWWLLYCRCRQQGRQVAPVRGPVVVSPLQKGAWCTERQATHDCQQLQLLQAMQAGVSFSSGGTFKAESCLADSGGIAPVSGGKSGVRCGCSGDLGTQPAAGTMRMLLQQQGGRAQQ